MMNDVRTYRAANMQEALDLVRQEMGSDAVILHTRQIPPRRFLPWKKRQEQVEITAGLDVNVRPPAALRRAKPKPAPRSPSPSPAPSQRQPTGQQLDLTSEPDPTLHGAMNQNRCGPGTTVHAGVPVQTARSAAGRSNLATPGGAPQSTFRDDPARAAAAGLAASPDRSTAELSTKIDSIKQMLQRLGQTSQFGVAAEIPGDLFNLYTDLIDADVADELARDLVFRLRENATSDQLGDATAAKALLTAMVEAEIRCCDPITPARGRRKVVALVGATGVGKTTTIAKLAANFRLRDDVKMGLVTVDTYRIAAVEQLRTYAEIIDLPMKVVTSPPEMRRALDELAGLDLVLIDTAGRSPRDELQIQELRRLLAEADVDEVHLVLSMTSSVRSIEATVDKFAAANITSLILTKLDEAAGMGSLLTLARKSPHPISYLTTGQDVPDDIEPAQATRIARLVLGDENIFE